MLWRSSEYFWFAADQLPQVRSALLYWNAAGLWRVPDRKPEGVPVTWRGLAAEKMLHLSVDWPHAASPFPPTCLTAGRVVFSHVPSLCKPLLLSGAD